MLHVSTNDTYICMKTVSRPSTLARTLDMLILLNKKSNVIENLIYPIQTHIFEEFKVIQFTQKYI